MNLVDILKVTVGAEHLVVGWIEHEGDTYALAFRNPANREEAVRFLMRAAQNTRRALGGGDPDGPCLCQTSPTHPVVWTSDDHEARSK